MTSKVLLPDYYEKFSCIGFACEDTCCSGWRIPLDDKTKNKYNKIPEINKGIEGSTIKLSSEGNCVFLSDEKMCSIQLKFGEEILSNTCSIYPRNYNLIDGELEASLLLSCPEVARLVLLNPDGINFVNAQNNLETRGVIHKKIDIKKLKHFWDIRIFCIQILQNRDYTISERLFILGMLMIEIQNLADEKILQTIDEFKQYIMSGELKDTLTAAEIPNIQMDFLKSILALLDDGGKGNERYKELLVLIVNHVEYNENYKIAYKTYYSPFMAAHEFILENYLVHSVFTQSFPFNGTQSMFEEYIILCIHYALIRFHLIGLSGVNQGLDFDIIVKLIQSYSKRYDHNPKTNKIIQLVKESGFESVNHLMVLFN
jgi:lysine-N-methylase